ncbi:MAG: MFS transporter [Candidatus Limnocylindrales bacterium]
MSEPNATPAVAEEREAAPSRVPAGPGTVAAPSLSVPLPWPLLVALFLAALSLRPQLVGLGPLLPEIQADLGISHAEAGLLTTIPVLCMGIFAFLSPLIAGRFGTAPTVAVSLVAIGAFGLLRVAAPELVSIAALTIGVGVGIGVAGTLLPAYVKERLDHAPVAGTVAYSSGLQLGSAISAAIAIPLALALGGWRVAMALFSGVTLLLLVPWLAIGVRDGPHTAARMRPTRHDYLDRRGWELAVVLAIFSSVYYGLISWLTDAYIEAGWTPAAAGGLVGLLNIGAFIGALSVGAIVGRIASFGATLVGMGVLFAASVALLAAVPAIAPASAILAGIANGALFTLVLTLPPRVARSPARAAGISSVMLGTGYIVAALSPIGLGAVRDTTGSFQLSLGALALAALFVAVGMAFIARWPAAGAESATPQA